MHTREREKKTEKRKRKMRKIVFVNDRDFVLITPPVDGDRGEEFVFESRNSIDDDDERTTTDNVKQRQRV